MSIETLISPTITDAWQISENKQIVKVRVSLLQNLVCLVCLLAAFFIAYTPNIGESIHEMSKPERFLKCW